MQVPFGAVQNVAVWDDDLSFTHGASRPSVGDDCLYYLAYQYCRKLVVISSSSSSNPPSSCLAGLGRTDCIKILGVPACLEEGAERAALDKVLLALGGGWRAVT